ncbi:MAG: phosphotransferase [Idiomarina sp.]|nr:phosphotransferase [Idiomarina sp.]
MSDARQQQLAQWLDTLELKPRGTLQVVSGDASFRRYFRYPHADRWLIAVDAPPPQESLQPFMAIAQRYLDEGLQVPKVHAFDQAQGFMVLDDFGDTLLFARLDDNERANRLYQQALGLLPRVMRATDTEQGALPDYDEPMLRRELDLFKDWLVEHHLQVTLSEAEERVWQDACQVLVSNALEQPQVGVHRDFHSRNIMCVEQAQADTLALIDFQDAVCGPITYDAVSLLRDCYVAWPSAMVTQQREFLQQRLRSEGLLDAGVSEDTFKRWFDLMGIQRHLKAAGIFARLLHRDAKPGYMADVPRTLQYIVDVSQAYPMLSDFSDWVADIQQQVTAQMPTATLHD